MTWIVEKNLQLVQFSRFQYTHTTFTRDFLAPFLNAIGFAP
jgi:hypothetical protein